MTHGELSKPDEAPSSSDAEHIENVGVSETADAAKGISASDAQVALLALAAKPDLRDKVAAANRMRAQ